MLSARHLTILAIAMSIDFILSVMRIPWFFSLMVTGFIVVYLTPRGVVYFVNASLVSCMMTDSGMVLFLYYQFQRPNFLLFLFIVWIMGLLFNFSFRFIFSRLGTLEKRLR